MCETKGNNYHRVHDFMARPVLLWPFLTLPILLLVHFGVDLFGENFTKIIFCFCFNVLIYKKFIKKFSVFFHFFFKNSLKIFLFICNKFLSTLHNKIQVQTRRYCFYYSVIPVTD